MEVSTLCPLRTAVALAAVTVTTDHHLTTTAGAVEQTGSARHRQLLPHPADLLASLGDPAVRQVDQTRRGAVFTITVETERDETASCPDAPLPYTAKALAVMGRAGRPEDIASAVAYLGLDAPYVTGQVLAVDGGRSLNI